MRREGYKIVFFASYIMYFDVLHWLVEEMCEVEQNTSLEKELSSIYFGKSLNKTWSPPEANSFPGFYSAVFLDATLYVAFSRYRILTN